VALSREYFRTATPPPPSTDQVTDDERHLLEQARQGDIEAFGRLAAGCRIAVFRAALAALRSPPDAEDAAQEAFLTAYRELHTFRGESSFKTWVSAIAWRKALDRRDGIVARLRRFVSLDAAAGEMPDSAGNQELMAIEADRASRLSRLIEALPAKLRDPLLLAAAGEHTGEEIGRLLEIPAGTVKSRLSLARARLKEGLRNLGYSDD
jgi:RNA polymerase sigma-70 factor, ECF subfamily